LHCKCPLMTQRGHGTAERWNTSRVAVLLLPSRRSSSPRPVIRFRDLLGLDRRSPFIELLHREIGKAMIEPCRLSESPSPILGSRSGCGWKILPAWCRLYQSPATRASEQLLRYRLCKFTVTGRCIRHQRSEIFAHRPHRNPAIRRMPSPCSHRRSRKLRKESCAHWR
jgi:hypothetical protein